MIISLKHNFIYIRTRKTASTSIHRTLEQVLGPSDICIRGMRGKYIDLSPVLRRGTVPPEEGFQTTCPGGGNQALSEKENLEARLQVYE